MLLQPLHGKTSRLLDPPSTSQNCASQHLPRSCIVLELQSADRQYIEQRWEEATGLSSAKVFVGPPCAGSCDRHTDSWDNGPALEGFSHRRAEAACTDLSGGATLHMGLRGRE